MLVERSGGRAAILEKATYSSLLFLAVSGNGVMAEGIRQLKSVSSEEPIDMDKAIAGIVCGVILLAFGIGYLIYSFRNEIKECICGKQEDLSTPLLVE